MKIKKYGVHVHVLAILHWDFIIYKLYFLVNGSLILVHVPDFCFVGQLQLLLIALFIISSIFTTVVTRNLNSELRHFFFPKWTNIFHWVLALSPKKWSCGRHLRRSKKKSKTSTEKELQASPDFASPYLNLAADFPQVAISFPPTSYLVALRKLQSYCC